MPHVNIESIFFYVHLKCSYTSNRYTDTGSSMGSK